MNQYVQGNKMTLKPISEKGPRFWIPLFLIYHFIFQLEHYIIFCNNLQKKCEKRKPEIKVLTTYFKELLNFE